MITELKVNACANGREEVSLSVPAGKAFEIVEIMDKVLAFAGYKVKRVNPIGEACVSADKVFFDASPAMALRGFRGKMEWTQQELAEKLGTTQNCISDMESGKRSISQKMAKRCGEIFNISYKVFL